MIRILIVDDHQLVREGVRRILDAEEDFTVVGEAANGEAALGTLSEVMPDVVLMDIAMPLMDGLEATRRIAKQYAERIRVLILTMYDDAQYATRLLRMGATGFVIKDAAPAELAEAIRTVHAGKRFISAPLRDALANQFIEGPQADPLAVLTDREFQVLRRLAAGATNRELAEELSLSIKTVDAHRLNLLAKLGLRNNADLARFALQNGVVTH